MSAARSSTIRHADRVLARSVLCIALAIYVGTFAGIPEVRDGEVDYQNARALARLSLETAGTPEADQLAEQRGTTAGAGVAQSLVAVPLYWTGWLAGEVLWTTLQARHEQLGYYGERRSEYFQHAFVGLRNPLLSALTAWLIVLIARRMGLERRHAWLAGVTYALTTFAWPQARSCLPEVQATFWLCFSFYWILRIRERFELLENPRAIELLAFGTSVGLAFLTRASLGLACLVLCVVGETVVRRGHRRLTASRWTPRDRRRRGVRSSVVLVFAPVLASLAVFALTNWLRFGSALDTGRPPADLALDDWGASARLGLLGVLASPGRGLFWMAPALLALPVGFAQAKERGERLWPPVALALSIAVLLPIAFQREWHGSWTYGPRFLLPLLPFLWLGVAFAFPAAGESRGLRVFLGATFALGLLVQLPAALVDHVTHQDMAGRAADIEFESRGVSLEADADDRFLHVQWSWGFAAPWAHWRILRHRVSGLDEEYPVREIFRVDSDDVLRPRSGRDEGFRHIAWVDLASRLGGPVWPGVVIVGFLAALGLLRAIQGLDRSAP